MIEIEFNGKQAEAEVAESPLKRALGLSFRKKGKMLFKFPRDTRAPIDMILMRKPLHLYFMDSDKKVIHREKAVPWVKLPEKYLHRPKQKYRYLLESFEELEMEEGEQVSF